MRVPKMATTVTIACPECEKQIKAPEAVLGKKIRCKACGHAFAAQAMREKAKPAGKGKPPARQKPPAKATTKPKAPPKPADDDEDDDNPYTLTHEELGHRCPFCANEVEEGDTICLHCGYNLVTRQRHLTRKVHDTTGADIFLWLLPAILCVIAIFMLITIDLLYCVLIGRIVDTSVWWGYALAHKSVKIWLVIVSMYAIWAAGKFAIRRLIYHYKPPEVEKH